MNKESRKELKINKILIIMGVVCSILAITIIILPSLNKAKIETLANSSKQMEHNYTTTTESNTWDISKNGDGSVIATLDENGVFTISGNGAMKGWSDSNGGPWYSVRGKIKNVKIENGITNIGGFAFCGFGITRIEIPASVTSIAESAFLWCKSLTNIEVDANNEKYCDENGVLCTKNKKEIIRYPEGKTETIYTIINGVTSIGDRAFEYCKNLTSIEIPESVTSIGTQAFTNCTNLTNIEIPESVTSIGRSAFRDCESLISIEIPESVTNIESYAFEGCTSLTTIEIPASVTSIERYAFENCESLTSIKLPKSVASMGDSVFSGCTSLTNIEVDANNEKYCDENGVLYTKDKKEIISYPAGKIETKYTIVNGVTSIGGGAFKGCKNLTTIEFPKSVTSIGDYGFSNCTSLTNIEIPEGVTRIGMHAFSNCKSLTSIEIPEGVTSIGNNAFENCKVTEVAETISNLIELPELIKRVQNESDILYSNEEFTLTNCIIEDGKVKLFEGETYGQIQINGGALDGLIYVISYTEWDISANEDGSVMAALDENWLLTITGIGEMKGWSGSGENPWYSVRNQIKNVKIENGVTSIGDHAFSGCTSLTTIEIPSSVTSIERYAFYNCESLTTIEIPSSVTSIVYAAFAGCKSLINIVIPASVTSIERDAFIGCKSLTSIEVDANNEKYCDENGVLYTKDKKEIIIYPQGKVETTYTIINGVTNIEDDAFYYCTSLTSIEIPNSVTSIGDSAFSGCTSLTTIKIPASVTYIDNNVFSKCENLTIICRSGSTAETYAKENSIKYQTDDIGPEIQSTPAANTNPSQKIEVKINVTDEISGVEEQSIRYLWTTENQDKTKDQITEQLTNGETLQLKDVTATYYLWIYAVDKLGNETIEKKGPFKLDNTAPTANINYSTTTITNQNVIVTIKGNEELQGIAGWTKSSNGKELTKEYTSNTVVAGENITIKDLAGNKSTVNVKILNIDKEQPSLEINSEITSTTIKVEATASDTGSGINESTCKYYIKEENGTYGEGIADGNAHTFTNLKTEQKYYIKVEVTDNAGNKANKEVQVTTKKSNKVTSTEYKINEEKLMIKEIQPKTTAGEIKNKIQGQIEFKIINSKGETVSDTAKVATGYKIKLEDNKEYTLVVTGDSNGDGETNIKDILSINKHRLNKANLVGAFLEAGDVNEDGKADIKDILQINKFRLGKISAL